MTESKHSGRKQRWGEKAVNVNVRMPVSLRDELEGNVIRDADGKILERSVSDQVVMTMRPGLEPIGK